MKTIVVLLQSKSAIAIKRDSAQNIKQATSPSYIKAEVIQWETAGFAQQLLSPTRLITRKIPKEKKKTTFLTISRWPVSFLPMVLGFKSGVGGGTAYELRCSMNCVKTAALSHSDIYFILISCVWVSTRYICA